MERGRTNEITRTIRPSRATMFLNHSAGKLKVSKALLKQPSMENTSAAESKVKPTKLV
jgi:hypothetical protein